MVVRIQQGQLDLANPGFVRPGERGTINLVGFFGISPAVSIDSDFFPCGLDLAFLLIGGGGRESVPS
jgi:hypothetical protein